MKTHIVALPFIGAITFEDMAHCCRSAAHSWRVQALES